MEEAATLREKGLPCILGAACAHTSIPAVFGPLLTLLKNPHFCHHRYSKQNAAKEMMQELQGSSLYSWGFEHLLGKSSLSKIKFCSPEAIADPLPICEHLNHNITGETVCMANGPSNYYCFHRHKLRRIKLLSKQCLIQDISKSERIFWNEQERSKKSELHF